MREKIIQLAGIAQVINPDKVNELFEDAELMASNPLLRKILKKALLDDGFRYLIKPSQICALDELEVLAPNFIEVISKLKKYLALAVHNNQPLKFPPILLTGDPGVGKTHFANLLSKALGLNDYFVSMGSLTAGFVLSGSAPTWTGAKMGKIAQALIEGEIANPLIILDELDKAAGDSRFDPTAVLYTLFESETSKRFTDEFLDITLDTSYLTYIATANYPERLPDPILSRMIVLEVPTPTQEQSIKIAELVLANLCKSNGWKFNQELSGDVKERLAKASPREMKKLLSESLGNALLSSRDYLKIDDFEKAKPTKISMGFN